ncbi:hypothetical protein ISN39_06685 [Rhizobium sp. 007]|nr:hypothetical protein ISN39_06685 [Rhizobium sp. 007]
MRENDEAERYHPEAENRQKAQETAEDQQDAYEHTGNPRARQRDVQGTENELSRCMIDAEALFARFSAIVCPVSHAQEMGTNAANASGCHFFEKTAWQIEQAFVLAHSRRAKR